MRAAAVALALVGCNNSAATRLPDDASSGSIDYRLDHLDPAEQAATFDRLCAAGDLGACRNLGMFYAKGEGVSPDPRRAVALFQQACAGKYLAACDDLAVEYLTGEGVERDASKAAATYGRACDGGNLIACRNLGGMLRGGQGVAADLPRAEALLERACKAKITLACTNLGDLDAQLATAAGAGAQGVPRWRAAIAHYKQGCDAGDSTGCRSLGVAYRDGKGVTKSAANAAMFLERACIANEVTACRVLGIMKVKGDGIAKDVERGRQILQRACDDHDDEACSRVSELDPTAGSPPDGSNVH